MNKLLGCGVSALAACAALGFAETALAQTATMGAFLTRHGTTGALDATFHQDGQVNFNPAGYNLFADVIAQNNDKVIGCGSMISGGVSQVIVVKYLSAGIPDTSFGWGGATTINYPNTAHEEAVSCTYDNDGKLVVVAAGRQSNQDWSHVIVMRFNPNGTLDSSFASGTGAGSFNWSGKSLSPVDVEIGTDNKIFVAITMRDLVTQEHTASVLRFGTDGYLDNSYGLGGISDPDISIGAKHITRAMALDPTGSAFVVTEALVGSQSQMGVMRLKPNGFPDNTFSQDSRTLITIPSFTNAGAASVVLDGNRIVVAGRAWNTTTGSFAVARLRADGSLDPDFSGDGRATATFSGAPLASAYDVVLDAGKIVVGGFAQPAGAAPQLALARFLTGGNLDTSFGTASSGMIRTPLQANPDGTPNAGGVPNAMALDGSGRVVLGGVTF